MSAVHEYEDVAVEGMVRNVAAANPGEIVVVVTDVYGIEVKTLGSVKSRLSEEEEHALLAGDSVTTSDGATMRRAVPS